ncbi:YrhA family protein [Pseudomonas syringae]|uniref:YrhA family protein n=1 Tax=Pseudomonas syringae TaxID=317 RepID=UPI000E30F386|nr:YrhA family protein [Pseudomonas syringae]
MNTLDSKISLIVKKYESQGYKFNCGADQNEIEEFTKRSETELKFSPIEEYLNILKKHNGMVVEGVFLYSTKPIKYIESDGYCLEFIEMNLLSRELEWKDQFIIFGDSDQDEYVLDLSANRYQVRDKQAFSNIYEEYETFIELFEYMLDLMISRVS